MIAIGSETRLEELAHHLFDVVTRFCLSMPRGRRRSGDLKEVEFLTLSLLNQSDTLIVGDIQRQLGVLPAQMSRIIRALETPDRPLTACRINPQDKLPFLATYLGHRDIHSTLVYITVTQDLLQQASERFRLLGGRCLETAERSKS